MSSSYTNKYGIPFLLLIFIIESCSNKNLNYINYYNSINEIDSIYRFKKDSLLVIKKYKKVFRKYPPKNQEKIEEYKTFIKLSDKFNKNFGGKKSLKTLISLTFPYEGSNKELFPIYKKYGIDSITIKDEINLWKKQLNKQLIDSFSIAMKRDQDMRHSDLILQKRNVNKNANLLIWTFENHGFPSIKRIGLKGNNNIILAIPTLLSHMAESEHYPFFEKKILEYVKSGECIPRDYALMVDSYKLLNNEKTYYGNGRTIQTNIDSLQINYNRKNIGLPSIKHYNRILKDYKLKNHKNK